MCQHTTTENDRSWYSFNIQKSRGRHTHNLDKIRDQKCDDIQSDRNTNMQCNILQVLHMQRLPNTNEKTKMLAQVVSACQTF